MCTCKQLAEIEIPSDMWGEEYELGAAIRKSRKYYALALVDAQDNVWEERAVSVKYEVFRGEAGSFSVRMVSSTN